MNHTPSEKILQFGHRFGLLRYRFRGRRVSHRLGMPHKKYIYILESLLIQHRCLGRPKHRVWDRRNNMVCDCRSVSQRFLPSGPPREGMEGPCAGPRRLAISGGGPCCEPTECPLVTFRNCSLTSQTRIPIEMGHHRPRFLRKLGTRVHGWRFEQP